MSRRRRPLTPKELDRAVQDLTGDSAETRLEAAQRFRKDREISARLLELVDSEPLVERRVAVLEALSWMQDPTIPERLIRLLDDASTDSRLRAEVTTALQRVRSREKRGSALDKKIGSALLAALRDDSIEVRYRAAMTLRSAELPQPLPEDIQATAFQNLTGAESKNIREAAIFLSDHKSATPPLLALLADEHRPENRHGILYALTWHADLRTWDLMVRILADAGEPEIIRGQAAEALAYMFHKVSPDSAEFASVVETLRACIKDPSPEVRYGAVFALGATKHPPLAPLIESLLQDHTVVPGWPNTVAQEAAEALEALHAQRRS